MTGSTSRWRLVLRGLGLTLLFAVAAAAGFAVGAPAMVERAGLGAVRQLEGRLGVTVAARAVHWTWSGQVAVDGLEVRVADAPADEAPLFAAERAVIEAEVSVAERNVTLRSVTLDRAVLAVVRRADGRDNVSSVIAGLRALLAADEGGSRGGGGGGALRYLARHVPTVALTHTDVVLDVPWPSLPLGLSVPKIVALNDGAIAVAADAPDAPTELTVKAEFRETSLDPGFGLGAELAVALDGSPRVVGARFDRPVRFYLGQRVAGVKGARWTPEGFEVSELQLSIPLDPSKPQATIGAAATVARLEFSPQPREVLRRIDEDGAAAPAGEAPSVAAVLGALDEIVVERPAMVLKVGPGGRHSFEDLLPALAWGAGSASPEADAAELLVAAADAASRRLLGAGDAPRDGEERGPSVRERVSGASAALEAAVARIAPRLARALGAFPFKQLDITDGRVALASPLGPINLEQLVVRGRSEGGARVEVSVVAPEVTRRPAQLAARLGPGGQGLEIDLGVAGLPLAYLGDALPKPFVLDGDGGVLHDTTLHFEWPGPDKPWLVAGGVQLRDAAVALGALASEPLRQLDLGFDFELGVDPAEARLALGKGRLRVKELAIDLVTEVRDFRERPVVHLEARLAETPAQAVVEAFPPAMMSALEGLTVSGTLAWDLTVDLDTGNLGGLTIDSRPKLVGFSVAGMGRTADFSAPRAAFSYPVLREDGTPSTRMSGPMTGRWVALADISPDLVKAVTTTEDGGFFRHTGISTTAIQESIITNLKEGAFVRGASTITQQVVKNLFLGGKKTVARKLQELFIAWQLEQNLSKDEIMALYLNIIEFGPGVYGIADAADRWFGKTAAELSLLECIFLSSIIPNPRGYYGFLEAGHVSVRWRNYLRVLLNIMVERGKITQEEADAQAPYDPMFKGAAAAAGAAELDLPLPDALPPADENEPPPW